MSRSLTDHRERGMAAMEALLSLPVVMVVLVLLFNFSSAVIQKSRARVAVREIAFRHLIDAAAVVYSDTAKVYEGTWPGVKDEATRFGWVNYSFKEKSVLTRGFGELTGSHPDAEKNDMKMKGQSGDGPGGSLFIEFANQALTAFGGQNDFEVWLRADSPFEGAIAPGAKDPMFPRKEFHAALYIDSSPWTKHEMPCGYLDVLTKALKLDSFSSGKVGIGSWLGCGEQAAPYDPGYRNLDEDAKKQAAADEEARREQLRKEAEERARLAEEAKKAEEEAKKNGGG